MVKNEKLLVLREIIIPNYPDKICVSKKRRPVYFISKDSSKKRGKKLIPKKYQNEELYEFNKEGILINKQTNEKVIANSVSAGKPKLWVVNFQEIYNGNVAKQKRACYINVLKDVLRPYIASISALKEEDYPIGLSIELFNDSFRIDASNKGVIYIKVIEDLLVSEKKIIDDNPLYITDSGRIILNESNTEDNKMVITLFKKITDASN